MRIIVLDVNDNPPVFSRPSYSTSLLEAAAKGSTILDVAATDSDLGVNKEIKYSVLTNPSLFSIENPSLGAITLKGSLRPEARKTVSFVVVARDLGVPSMSALATVTIDVLDSSDNNPVFTQVIYRQSVEENMPSGVSLVTVNATEKTGAVVIYSITAGNDVGLFRIDSLSVSMAFGQIDMRI